MPFKDPEAQKAYQKAYRKTERVKELRKCYMRKWRYGLTTEAYQELLDAQHGMCGNRACARLPEENRNGRLFVDHCKFSGLVRGLLCDDCNITLGKMLHEPSRLRGLADYLERTN